MPKNTPAIMRQEAIRANTISKPPMIRAKVETSPTEPGILPINASNQVMG